MGSRVRAPSAPQKGSQKWLPFFVYVPPLLPKTFLRLLPSQDSRAPFQLFNTPSHIVCAHCINILCATGTKPAFQSRCEHKKREKHHFLCATGQKRPFLSRCEHSKRSGHSPGTLTPVLRPSNGGLCSRWANFASPGTDELNAFYIIRR